MRRTGNLVSVADAPPAHHSVLRMPRGRRSRSRTALVACVSRAARAPLVSLLLPLLSPRPLVSLLFPLAEC